MPEMPAGETADAYQKAANQKYDLGRVKYCFSHQ